MSKEPRGNTKTTKRAEIKLVSNFKKIKEPNWQDFIKWCEERNLEPNEGKNLRRFVKEVEEEEGK
jgi:ribosomal protein S19E (S16A)